MSNSFAHLATVTASTKRAGGIVDGLESDPTTVESDIACLPLDPINPDLMLGIEGLGWRETLQTAVEGDLDIVEGDLLVVDGTEYPIRAVADWTWRDSEYKILYLEDVK